MAHHVREAPTAEAVGLQSVLPAPYIYIKCMNYSKQATGGTPRIPRLRRRRYTSEILR